MNDRPDPLDAVRAPVPVGAPAQDAGHPAIDARTIVPRPTSRTGPVWAAPAVPPDPLGVLGPRRMGGMVGEDDVFEPATPTGGRPRWLGAVAAATVLVLVGSVVLLATRPDGGTEPTLVASEPTAAASAPSSSPPAPTGLVEVTAVTWGRAAGVCPDAASPCYMATASLVGYPPDTSVPVTCAVDGADAQPEVRADFDADGAATVTVACPEAPRAIAFMILVDGRTAAYIDLPTTIEPAPIPTVTVSVDRSAVGEPGCSAPACRFADVTLEGFPPGETVVVDCHGAVQGAFGGTRVTIGPDGTATDEACYFGYAGETFWVEAGGVASATVIWPES